MRVNKHYMLRQILDDWVIIPMMDEYDKHQSIYVTNETGAFIWNLLCKDVEKVDIYSSVCKEFECNDSDVKHDVDTFLNNLITMEMVIE